MAQYTGTCFCGGVKYQLTGEANAVFVCHCLNCQKISGSAFATNAMVDQSAVEIVQGKELVKTYTNPAPPREGAMPTLSFCSVCGSSLFAQDKQSEESRQILVVMTGLLDDAGRKALVPQGEAFCKRKREWAQVNGVGASFDEMPPR